ncbi:MAG: hypothetical protein JWO82_1170, partial [Akkermansiaceae bacterium]|nr:hypothetical protein [Akkermansiaceae bacterium]
ISDSQRYTEVTNRRQEAYTASIVAVRETIGKLTEVAGDAGEYRKAEAP